MLTATAAATGGPSLRFEEFDALRGIAAFTVILHHFALMWPAVGTLCEFSVRGVNINPLVPLTAGHEAVILFFTLSGFVLALPYLRGRGQPYRIFIARRALRLYAPYLVALALAVCGAAIWHSGLKQRPIWVANQWSTPIDFHLVAAHIAFIGVYNYFQYNSVVWTLIYEMRLSIVFPVLAFLVLRTRTLYAVFASIAASLLVVALLGIGAHYPHQAAQYNILMTLHYMAFFVLGIVMARHLEPLGRWYTGLSKSARIALLIACTILFYESSRIVDYSGSNATLILNEWCVFVGSAGFLLIALHSTSAKRILHSAVPVFLGRVSYSLYLTHLIVLFILTYTVGDKLSPLVQLPIFVVGSIVVSWIFCLLVEEPFTRMGQRLGRRQRQLAAG